jgi:cellulose synthase (UDP-forming)
MTADIRLETPRWDPSSWTESLGRLRLLRLATVPLAIWYFGWLLRPERIGQPVLYAVLVACELFNAAQALGFWWTCSHARHRQHLSPWRDDLEVDILIPTCGEPVSIVEPTVVAATRLRGARARVWLLDDGPSEDIELLARRQGVDYVRRPDRRGAKAGSLNHALGMTTAPFVAVFDCDHVPSPAFLERTIGHMADERVAFVQTPQYYANARSGGVPAASWGQQALFFGPIASGKDGLDAMFCCGTNVVFRRTALEDIGGFPEVSLTEDFLLSVAMHERGWRTVYVPEVLASGLGPEDMASYVSQQHRWARGCLSAIPRVLRARLPGRVRLQYLLSSMFFFTGWTFLVYMSLPVIRLLTGAQPVSAASADQFLLHFLPYFTGAILSVAVAGRGRYTFDAFTLMVANFWVHVHAAARALFGRPGRFVVTPKEGENTLQPSAVLPALVAIGVLVATAGLGLWRDFSAGTLNNVAFAALHVTILAAGALPALRRSPMVGEEVELRPELRRLAAAPARRSA